MSRIWTAAAVVAVALLPGACDRSRPVAAAQPDRLVTVQGEAHVMAKPDTATVTVGVTTDGDTANLALAENNTRMTTVLQKVGALGIPESDVQTSELSVYPRYAQPDPAKPQAPQQIVGYSVSNTVTLTVRDLARLGEALDQFVSAAGANTVRELSFGFADPTALQDDARRKAMTDAKRKAELYAAAAGAKVGQILEVSEDTVSSPEPFQPMMRMQASAAVPIAPGQNKLSATVRVVYELE